MNVPIYIVAGLPHITITLHHEGAIVTIDEVLLDTGSMGSVFNTDILVGNGITLDGTEIVVTLHGIGGTEDVLRKKIDKLAIAPLFSLTDVFIEVGRMNYGVPMNGIIGFDVLARLKLTIDLDQMALTKTL